jgi:hypothetical protein
LCKDCRRLLAEKEQLADENRWLLAQVRDEALDEAQLHQKLLSENEHLTEEVSGLLYTTRKHAASIAALKRELRKERAADPESQRIRVLLARWQTLTGHVSKQVNVEPGGARWEAVRKTMKHYAKLLEPGEVDALIDEALQGLALMPYVGEHGGRAPTGHPARRYDEPRHALLDKNSKVDEGKIEAMRLVKARAGKASSSVLLDVYAAVGATETLYATAVLDALAREEDAKRVKDAEYNGYVRRLVDDGQAAASRNGDMA